MIKSKTDIQFSIPLAFASSSFIADTNVILLALKFIMINTYNKSHLMICLYQLASFLATIDCGTVQSQTGRLEIRITCTTGIFITVDSCFSEPVL